MYPAQNDAFAQRLFAARWAAEFINHCGLLTWHNNSRIIHAVSTVATGPYAFSDVAVPVYRHNPSVGAFSKRDRTSSYVCKCLYGEPLQRERKMAAA